jgi:hypothetical protein
MTTARQLGLVVAVFAMMTASCDQRPGPWREEHGLESPEVLGLEQGEETTIVGTVVANTLDPCVIDDHPDPCAVGGPAFLRVEVDGVGMSVNYDYGEYEECESRVGLHTGAEARVGMRVEVFGLAAGGRDFSGTLDVCASEEYYIELLD